MGLTGGVFMIGKKGQQQGLLATISVVALVALVLFQFGFFSGFGGAAPSATPGAATTSFCPDSSVTMTVGQATAWRAPATSVATEYHRVYVEGIDQGLKADGATVSVRVAKPNGEANKVKVYYAENSTLYYGAESSFDVPCGAFDSASLSGGKHRLGNHSPDFTFNAFNSDDGDLNSVSNNLSITSNEEVTYTLDFKGTSDQVLSPYGNVIVVVDYNDTEFDGSKIRLEGGSSTAIPSIHTLLSTAFKSKAWTVAGGPNPSVDESGRWTLSTDLVVKAKSGTDPVPDKIRSFLNVTLYSENFYQDPDSATELFGSENNR